MKAMMPMYYADQLGDWRPWRMRPFFEDRLSDVAYSDVYFCPGVMMDGVWCTAFWFEDGSVWSANNGWMGDRYPNPVNG